MTTPSPQMRTYRERVIAEYAGSQEAQQLFYLSTVFAAAEETRAHLRRSVSVVMDRYFLSTQAYATFRGSQLQLDEIEAALLPADLTVYLDAPHDVRSLRMQRRGANTAADRETFCADADARLRDLHVARAELRVIGRFLRVGSSMLSADAVVERVVAAVREISSTGVKRLFAAGGP